MFRRRETWKDIVFVLYLYLYLYCIVFVGYSICLGGERPGWIRGGKRGGTGSIPRRRGYIFVILLIILCFMFMFYHILLYFVMVANSISRVGRGGESLDTVIGIYKHKT